MVLWDLCYAMGSPVCGERSFLICESSCGKRYACGCRVECDSFRRLDAAAKGPWGPGPRPPFSCMVLASRSAFSCHVVFLLAFVCM
jgi:hypothetical protein